MYMHKTIIYIDMDGVLADFNKAISNISEEELVKSRNEPDNIPGIFEHLEPVVGAVEAVEKLNDFGKFELFILTTAPWNNPTAWMHKRLWVERYFGELFYKKIIITHRKDLIIGDYLIDDRLANGASNFKGMHLHFGWDYINKKFNKYPDWPAILHYFEISYY